MHFIVKPKEFYANKKTLLYVNFAETVLRTDKGLFEKVHSWVKKNRKDFNKALKIATDEVGSQTRAGQTLKEAGSQARELYQAWADAFSTALENSTSQQTDVDGDVQNQVRQSAIIKKYDSSKDNITKNLDDLASAHSVYTVDKSKLIKTGKKPTDIFAGYFESWENTLESDELGTIALRKSSIRSEIRHGITAEKIASIEAIPTVIKKGKIIFAETKAGSDVQRIVVAAPIKIGSTPYYMGVMLQRDNQNQTLYLHNVAIEKEAFNLTQADLLTTGADVNNERLFITSILQNALTVKYKKEFSKTEKSDTQNQARNQGRLDTDARRDLVDMITTKGFVEKRNADGKLVKQRVKLDDRKKLILNEYKRNINASAKQDCSIYSETAFYPKNASVFGDLIIYLDGIFCAKNKKYNGK